MYLNRARELSDWPMPTRPPGTVAPVRRRLAIVPQRIERRQGIARARSRSGCPAPASPRSCAPRTSAASSSATEAAGNAPASSASTPATCGAASELPDTVAYDGTPPCETSVVRTFTPGATSCGNTAPSQLDGPRLDWRASVRSRVHRADRQRSRVVAGAVARALRAGPSLPAAKTTAMPLLRSARMSSLNSAMQAPGASAGQRPRRVDDVGRVDRRRVAVGIHQPLEGPVNVAHARAAVRVVQAHRDPARVGRDAQRAAAQHDSHRLRAVAERVVGRGFFAVRVEPAVRAAAPLAPQVRMREIDAGVHRRHHHAPAGMAQRPHLWCLNGGEVPARGRARHRALHRVLPRRSPVARPVAAQRRDAAYAAPACAASARPGRTNRDRCARCPSGLASCLTATAGSVAARPLMIHRSRDPLRALRREQRLDGGAAAAPRAPSAPPAAGCRARADRSRPTADDPPGREAHDHRGIGVRAARGHRALEVRRDDARRARPTPRRPGKQPRRCARQASDNWLVAWSPYLARASAVVDVPSCAG